MLLCDIGTNLNSPVIFEMPACSGPMDRSRPLPLFKQIEKCYLIKQIRSISTLLRNIIKINTRRHFEIELVNNIILLEFAL